MAQESKSPSENKTTASAKGNFPIFNAVSAAAPMIVSAQIAVQQQQLTTGPLPSPELLKKYEDVYPGLVNRIVTMAEQEAAHRRTTEAEIVATQSRDQKAYRRIEILGTVCGLAIGLAAIGGAVYAGIHGAQFTGTFIGTAGVTGLVTAFIMGRTALLKLRKQDFDYQKAITEAQALAKQPQK